ncbi:MAG: MFS transporter [Acidimicrobiia bacterium]|nr:MFS transporter [Actinomycetota bacterium]MBL6926859.1 MFS transporter [Acidimicrobiia bacterium]
MSIPTRHGDPNRWRVFGGLFGIYFSFGVVAMSIAPIVGEVRADLGLSRGSMGMALGAWQLVYIATAPPAGRLVDRLGLRRSLALGALVIIASGLTRVMASGLVGFWLAIALFGVGGPLVSAGAPKVVSTWFSDTRERRFAVGAYNTAPALGGMATLVLSNSVLMPLTGSWRATVVIETGAMVVAVAVWLVVSRHEPPVVEGSGQGVSAGGVRDLLAEAEVRAILAFGIGVFFIAHGLGGWLPSVLRSHSGFSAMAAANWTALGGVVGISTSLLLPRRASRDRLPRFLAAILVVVAVGLIAVIVLPTALDPLPVAAIGVRSALIPLTILMLMDCRAVGPGNMGLAFGMWFAVAEVGGVTGPLVIGWVGDSSVGFSGALVVLAGVCGLLLAVVAHLSRLHGRDVGSPGAGT